MHGEKLGWNTMLYFAMTLGFWVPALYFFTGDRGVTSWDQPNATSKGESAALSRDMNQVSHAFNESLSLMLLLPFPGNSHSASIVTTLEKTVWAPALML